MRKVKLTGKSALGKNRIRENGNIWVVTGTADRVHFSTKPGLWLNVQPEGKPDKARWVNLRDDENFTVESVE